MDREYHASASLGGYLYCISSDTAERFDPVSEAWCLIEPMPLTCENLQAVGAKVKITGFFLDFQVKLGYLVCCWFTSNRRWPWKYNFI